VRPVLPGPPSHGRLDGYAADLLRTMYARMVLIRTFERKSNELFLMGLMPGTLHLSEGQEATAVGACFALGVDDRITLTHRGHGQALAKGVSPDSLMAELFGRETGCCRGRGGSLHVGDWSVGALPAIAVVGASAPIAVGFAFASRHRDAGRVALTFFGEGAAAKGEIHEAMGLAALWDLPVIFLCENNLYAVSTPQTGSMKNERVSERAAGYRMPGVTVDGNDPIAVYDAVTEAAQLARTGKGPSLVECLTYRHGGHKRDDAATYRPQEEVAAWLSRDPIPAFRARLAEDGRIAAAELDAIDAETHEVVERAAATAQASPYPDPAGLLEEAYV